MSLTSVPVWYGGRLVPFCLLVVIYVMPLEANDSVLLDSVRSVRWPARKKSPVGLAGNHLSKVLGVSAEFTEYRAYRQGDDTNRIDWKLLARSDRAYVRLSNDRTVLSTMLLMDASGSLAYPEATLENWHFARQVTIGLASAAYGGNDPVGLLIATAEGPKRLPPRTRRGVVQNIATVLGNITPKKGSPAWRRSSLCYARRDASPSSVIFWAIRMRYSRSRHS